MSDTLIQELRRVLYVEDNPDIASIAKLALERLGGLEVCICSNAEEALGFVAKFKPDMILLDVMLPGMDGPALLQQLRNLDVCRGVPFVFLTAKAQASDVRRLKALGVADVIPKPFDPLTLADLLRKIWMRVRAD